MDFLSGYKTYVVAILIGVVAAVLHLGYIDQETANTITILLTGGGLASLRSAVSKGQ